MPFTEEEIESIRSDCFANDVPYDLETFADMTEDELIAYFESGGEDLPEGVPKPKPKPKERPKPPPKWLVDALDKAGEEEKAKGVDNAAANVHAVIDESYLENRKKVQGVLCLHGMAHCSKIMQKQLRPLGLEAAGDIGEVRFLDGELLVDVSLHPEAKRIRAFYPAFENRAYMHLYERHKRSSEERPYVLKPEDKDERPLNPPRLMDEMPAAPWEKPKEPSPWQERYRGIEAALTLLAKSLAASRTPASHLGIVAYSQGANLLTMLLALVDAAVVADASVAAGRRKQRLWPACVVLICPTTDWIGAFTTDPPFCAKALAAIDRGIAHADADAAGEAPPADAAASVDVADLTDVADTVAGEQGTDVAPPPQLLGVFARKLPVPALVILGQWDPSFESGRYAGLHLYHRAQLMKHEEAHKIPQEREFGEAILRLLRAKP